MLPPREVGRVASIGNVAAAGSIGAAVLATDVRVIAIAQTTTGLALTLPAPSDASVVVGVDVVNTGSAAFTLYGQCVLPGSALRCIWNGSAWIVPMAVDPPSYKVANLPMTGNVDGQLAWASDGRALTYTATLVVGQQTAGNGTGVLVSWSAKAGAWAIVGTTLAPSA